MDVLTNGRVLLSGLDVRADAGGSRRAYIRSFRGIRPTADGYLRLRFEGRYDNRAFVNGIELMPMASDRIRPMRFVIRDGTYIDDEGRVWHPDTYVTGGWTVARNNVVASSYDAGLFRGERFGHFTYVLPLPPGEYTLRLYFAETWFGAENPGKTGPGTRVFNVFCNQVPLLKNFDVLKEAGANRAVRKQFTGLKPDRQGKLTVEFVPIHNYAFVNAIEVIEDAK